MISLIIITIAFIAYLYFTDKYIKDNVIEAEMAIRTNMERSYRAFLEKIEAMEKELEESLKNRKEELDERLIDYADYFIMPTKEDYDEIRLEISRRSDAFRAYEGRINQFKRSLPMDKSTRDTEDLNSMILVVFQAYRDYYSCLEQHALEQEVYDQRLETQMENLNRRRRLTIPEMEEDDFDPCRDETTALNTTKADLEDFIRDIKRRPITF